MGYGVRVGLNDKVGASELEAGALVGGFSVDSNTQLICPVPIVVESDAQAAQGAPPDGL